jgi:cell division initiation protein
MMTPQEVASHAFSKATLGGYNMAMVDEFLDLLTEDYTALYNDNAILKNKLKVLSDTVEEYRATDNAMRKTLLAAQQMAEAMVSEAEKKKDELVHNAEAAAQTRLAELQKQIADEERRLQAAKESTASYVREVRQAHQSAVAYLDRLGELTADTAPAASVAAPAAAAADLSDTQVFQAPQEPQAAPAAVAANAADAYADDPDATRRFEDLQFGKDYNIK